MHRTVAVPVSSFASSVEGSPLDLTNIKQIVLPFYTNSATGYKGALYVDNIRYKNDVAETAISDFNKEGSSWSEYESGTNDNVSLSITTKPDDVSVRGMGRMMATGYDIFKVT